MSDETSVKEPVDTPDEGPKRRGKVKKKHTVGLVLLASMVVLTLVTGLSVAFVYRHLNGNITTSDAFDDLVNRPEKQGDPEALNILVLGSDTRSGAGNAIDGESGMGGSDTTILLHLSADRERAYGVSIPRDSLVERPDCIGEDGETIPGGELEIWNEAYALGGEACTIQQFEHNTDVRVDDFVVVDFNGFKGMVDAVGGVPVCIPYDINDPAHGIQIDGGDRVLKGDEALDYVRVRYVGTKSDLGRIKRQQNFIAGMINQTVSAGTLTRPDRIFKLLEAGTKSLTTSPNLDSVTELTGLALSVQDVGLGNIQFVTVPWEPHPTDANRIGWLPKAKKLWRKITLDKPLSKGLSKDSISAEAPPGLETPATTPSADPSTAPSETPTEEPSETPSLPSETPSPSVTQAPTEEEIQEAENAGLCA